MPNFNLILNFGFDLSFIVCAGTLVMRASAMTMRSLRQNKISNPKTLSLINSRIYRHLGDAGVGDDGAVLEIDERVQLHGGSSRHLCIPVRPCTIFSRSPGIFIHPWLAASQK